MTTKKTQLLGDENPHLALARAQRIRRKELGERAVLENRLKQAESDALEARKRAVAAEQEVKLIQARLLKLGGDLESWAPKGEWHKLLRAIVEDAGKLTLVLLFAALLGLLTSVMPACGGNSPAATLTTGDVLRRVVPSYCAAVAPCGGYATPDECTKALLARYPSAELGQQSVCTASEVSACDADSRVVRCESGRLPSFPLTCGGC